MFSHGNAADLGSMRDHLIGARVSLCLLYVPVFYVSLKLFVFQNVCLTTVEVAA
jgi:hypothetical protein